MQQESGHLRRLIFACEHFETKSPVRYAISRGNVLNSSNIFPSDKWKIVKINNKKQTNESIVVFQVLSSLKKGHLFYLTTFFSTTAQHFRIINVIK